MAGSEADPLIELMYNGSQNLMVGNNITIICVTRNTSLMAWSSEEYISEGGVRLQLASIDGLGATAQGRAAVANLTRVSSSPPMVLESQLHIMVLANFSQFSVTCRNSAHDLQESLVFQLGKTCTVHNSGVRVGSFVSIQSAVQAIEAVLPSGAYEPPEGCHPLGGSYAPAPIYTQ